MWQLKIRFNLPVLNSDHRITYPTIGTLVDLRHYDEGIGGNPCSGYEAIESRPWITKNVSN